MIAENNTTLSEATQTLYRLNADELLREQCRAREEYEIHEKYTQGKIATQAKQIENLTNEIETKDNEIKAKDNEIKARDNEIEEIKKENEEQAALIAQLQEQLAKVKAK